MIPLGIDQLLLRGSSLRNTEYIYGLVVFTGHETKVMRNSVRAKNKFSKLEMCTGKYIIAIVIIQTILAFIAAFINSIWEYFFSENFTYLDYEDRNFFLILLINIGTWFIVLSTAVPISLLVTLELVKFAQAVFIYWDINIYDHEKDMNAMVQSSNLNEELGTVHYVFSDKTGTLT